MRLPALPLTSSLTRSLSRPLSRSEPATVLELDLAGGVVVGPAANPLEALRQRNAPTVRSIREGLTRAARDRRVLGLLVHVGTAPLALADADEVAGLIADFAAEKPTVAFSESFGELGSGMAGYRVAIAAREIWLQPTGGLGLVGVAAGITLLRGALEKVGVEPQFGQRHQFKSAADRFAAETVTEANREMTQRLVSSLVDDTVSRVAARRGLAADDVRELMAHAPLPATRALEGGLVDRLGYRDEVYAWARETWTPEWRPRYVQRYAADGSTGLAGLTSGAAGLARRGKPVVGVVDVRGPIVTGAGTASQAGADRVCARLREMAREDAVRGVVLRVDSPGGSAVASDAIRREVQQLRASGRPVVATMGSMAASGGYFVSMGADEIVAQPTTLTGSIGVLAGKLVVSGLLDRLGLVHETVSGAPRAAMMTATRAFDEEEWRVLDAWLDEVYADFTAKAAADRGMPLDVLEPLARGRVWTGADAHERGLVDHLGGSRLGLDRVCALAGVDPDDVTLATRSPFDVLRQLKPAESSESPGGVLARTPEVTAASPEAVLHRVAELVGISLPHGVLTLPPHLATLTRPL